MALLTTKLSDAHLELFCLVWLHDNPNEPHDTEQKLRAIINHLVKFKDVQSCQKYIEGELQSSRIILVVSGRLGSEIVPQIHKLRQIISIYVFCMDKERNKKWADKFSKIKAVVVHSNELVSSIKADHKIQKITEEPLSINFFHTEKSTGDVKGHFIFFQVLIDCLLRLKSSEQDRKELIDFCKEQYNGNLEELDKIHEFQREYSAKNALRWYTLDSFFYKTLNAALRNQDIHLMFLFRQYISDIQRHLQNNQIQNELKVYRGQLISNDELQSLEKCSGQLISINSFFSTSTEYQQALFFLDISNCSNDLVPVLFEIDADPNMAMTKPFANIHSFSTYPNESEVLFMIGSIFRLKHIERNRKTNICTVQMTLCSENDLELKQVLIRMKKQLGTGDTNLQILSRFLANMGQRNLAEKYLVRLLDQLSPTHPSRVELYEELAVLASQNEDLDKSAEWLQKVVDFEKQVQSNKGNLTVPTEKKLDRLPSPFKLENEKVVDKDRCNKCFKTFQSGESQFTSKGLVYHEHCFLCDSCFKPIGTKEFILKDTKHYCLPCYGQYFATKCAGCHQVIKHESTTYKNQSWHPECFTCTHCKIRIISHTFPTHNDHPYCQYCYDQLFAKKCYACHRSITGPGNIRFVSYENHDWHTDCFRCQRCQTLIGEQKFCKQGLSIVCVICSRL